MWLADHVRFNCLREQLKVMQSGASIVNAASIAGLMGVPKSVAYAAGKVGSNISTVLILLSAVRDADSAVACRGRPHQDSSKGGREQEHPGQRNCTVRDPFCLALIDAKCSDQDLK